MRDLNEGVKDEEMWDVAGDQALGELQVRGRDGILGKIRGTVDKRGQWWTGGRDEIRHFFGRGAIGVLGCGVKIEGTISTFELQSTLFRFFCTLLGTPRPKRNLTNGQRQYAFKALTGREGPRGRKGPK
jgi:hypothetical protein